MKRYADNETLSGYSPFDVGFGQWANCIEIGLGEDMGFVKIWNHGELEVWGNDADPMGPPSMVFTPEHADLLEQLARELRSREEEYKQHQAEKKQ